MCLKVSVIHCIQSLIVTLRTSQPGETELGPHTPSTCAGMCNRLLLLLLSIIDQGSEELYFHCAGFDQVSEEAARNLHTHAVDALMLCWGGSPPEAADRQQLLLRLLPAKGWPLRPLLVETTAGSSCDPHSPAADSAWLPLPSQRAEAAKMLLEQVSFFSQSVSQSTGQSFDTSSSLHARLHPKLIPAMLLSPAVFMTEPRWCRCHSVLQSLQAGGMALEDLTRFAQACLATVATAYKHQDLSHQVTL